MPLHYLATKYHCKISSRELQFLPQYTYLLPRVDSQAIKKSNDSNDYVEKKKKIKLNYFTVFKDGYVKVFDLLHSKLCKNESFNCNSDVILFDSFNSANYLKLPEGKIELISFLSTLFIPELLKL